MVRAAETGGAELSNTETLDPRAGVHRRRLPRLIDDAAGWYAAIASVWLAVVLIAGAFSRGWEQIWYYLAVYVVIAYFLLPRVHTLLSRIYLPDYFIGRTRTREGILGDPVNLGFQGDAAQLHHAMTEAGWTLADDLGIRANLRIVLATLTRRSYPSAPVSNLYLFGRKQEFCYQQEVDGSPGKRHHVRFWSTPEGWLLPGGHHVDWLAAGTFDRSVGFSMFTWQITHRISQHVDSERDHVLQTLEAAGVEPAVEVLEKFSTGYHSRNGGGDRIVTDGNLPIVGLEHVPETSEDLDRVRQTTGIARPFELLIAVVLMALRPIDTISTFLTAVGIRVPDWSLPALPVLLGVGAGVTLVGTLLWYLLGYWIWQGHDWARVTALLLSSITVTTGGILALPVFEHLTVKDDLVGLTADVAILLILSSTEARAWTLGSRRARRITLPKQVRRLRTQG
jgi:hypothetical protein